MATVKKSLKIDITADFLVARGDQIFKSSKSARSMIEDRWAKDIDLYESRFSSKEREFSQFLGIPRLFIPKTYTNLNRILVDVMETVYPDSEEIVDITSWKSIPYETLQITKALMNYRLNSHPIDFYKEAFEAGMDSLKSIIAVMKVYPRLKTLKETKKERINFYGKLVDFEYKEEKIISYEPRMHTVPPEDIFISRFSTWKDYWRYPLAHRYPMYRSEAKELGYNGWDIAPAITDPNISDTIKTARNEDTLTTGANDNMVSANDVIMCYEFWDLLPGEEEELVSGSFILLGDENQPSTLGQDWKENELPYKFSEFEPNRPPIVIGLAMPESHRLYGKSFPWITEALQQETNAQRNQEREAVARALRPTTYLNREARVDLMSLVNRRIGGYVMGDGPASNAIQEIPTANPEAISPIAQSRTDRDYAEAGIPPNLLGSSTGEDTATGQTQQLSNALKKVAFMVRNLNMSLFLPAFQLLLRLEQTYETDEFIKMVTGRVLGWGFSDDEFPARSVIQGDFDLKVNMGVNKQSQVNKMFLTIDRLNQANQSLAQLVQMGVADPAEIQFYNPMKVFGDLLPLLGRKNIDELKIQAKQPPPQEGPAKGIASQPRNQFDPGQAIAQSSPQATGILG